MSLELMPETCSYLLSNVCRLYRTRKSALLGEIGLYIGQDMILASLWEKEGVTQTELAGQFRLQAATVTNTLQRMEKAGLMERRQDAEDQRISRVYLTDAGRDIRDQVHVVWSKLEEQTFAGLNAEESILFRRLLLRIHNNLAREG